MLPWEFAIMTFSEDDKIKSIVWCDPKVDVPVFEDSGATTAGLDGPAVLRSVLGQHTFVNAQTIQCVPLYCLTCCSVSSYRSL